MNRLVILAALMLSVVACGRNAHQAPAAQAVVLRECKTGVRAGEICSRAQAAEAHRNHQEAENAFRSMTEGK